MSCRMLVLLLVTCFCLFSQGCTYRAWYEGLQERQRMECNENRGQGEIQKCLDRVNSTTYDEYVKSREAAKKPSK
jgi:hypothetical protein